MTARLPLKKAVLTGAAAKNPQRYRDRSEPETKPLGDPPKHLSATERAAWRAFAQELPWLADSDRALLASACALRARVQAGGDISTADIRELRMHLVSLGATPIARQNVVTPEDPEDDPWAKFL
ncbi:hypothetical protein [Aquicoccus sp. SU-CL01552]|uniref:hypothetical protein n=1 Tax=Aquicoccus sp. SU-CL01552 TaxID=3127656 RepID=UPI00310A0229